MYTSGELERIGTAFDKPMKALEMRIMTDIIRRIKDTGEITSAADWQINRLAQLTGGMNEVNRAIAEALDFTEEDVQALYSGILETGHARDAALYKAAGALQIPLKDNEPLQQLLSSVSAQTNETLRNITQSLGFAQRGADGHLSFTPIADYYQKTLDSAALDIASGAFDYNTVLKRTVREMTNSGLRTVHYASGWSNRVDVAARRAVMTGMNQLTAKVSEDNAEKLGTEWVEISWHSGARPSHWWGGKWFTRQQLVTVCGLGTVTGLCGANCYHHYDPVIPGISVPAYTDEELASLNEQEKQKTEWRGQKFNRYEATQKQRRMETSMRAQRSEIALLEKGGAAPEDIAAARARYNITQHEYVDFSKTMGIPQQFDRVMIDGRGTIGNGTPGDPDRPSPVKIPPVGAKRGTPVTPEERRELLSRDPVNVHESSIDNSGETGIIEDKEKQFIPAKTIAEAEQYGRQFADTVNYSGLSLDNVNIINETLTELNRLYPTNKLEIITSNSKLKNSSARSSCVSLSINPLIGTLGKPSDELRKETISSLKKWKAARAKAPASLQKKYDNNIKQLEESLKYDRWSVSNGIDTKKTITHEYGHIIADQYFGQINNKLANPNCYSEEGVKLRRLVNEAYQKAKSTGDIYKISEYASSDEQEFFAETFAMYHLGEELPEYINDMVKGVLEHGAV